MAAMGRSGRTVSRQCDGSAVQLDLRGPVSRLGMARAVLAQHRYGRDRTLHPAGHSRNAGLHRIVEEKRIERAPVIEVLKRQPKLVALTALARMGQQGPFYIFAAFIFTYGTTVLHSSRNLLLAGVMCATALSAVTTPLAGHLSDRFGRKRMYIIGIAAIGVFTFVYFALLNTAIPAVVFVAIILSFITHDMAYGPQAALIAECFPARLRYSGSSLAGCGKSRDFEKMAMERARYRNEGHIRSMAYGRAPGDEWQRNDDQSTFSASCYQIGVDPRAVPQDYRCDGTGIAGLDPLDRGAEPQIDPVIADHRGHEGADALAERPPHRHALAFDDGDGEPHFAAARGKLTPDEAAADDDNTSW